MTYFLGQDKENILVTLNIYPNMFCRLNRHYPQIKKFQQAFQDENNKNRF